MESMMSGTLAGTGSFRCEECGYVVNLAAADELPACPGCGGSRFTRASLFAGGRVQRKSADAPTPEEIVRPASRADPSAGDPVADRPTSSSAGPDISSPVRAAVAPAR